ncbi:MAG: metalloregulator ArsR/SmtB family transcription factor [Verrucomicrobiae bacterium]|nr:metalloregulator ArsR/SmtB family transcription factor [Verrucomicrobiae bacterium]NNJ43646.1 helix-turn-helix transcriptional regulator [Akkermansiaceae bacterium]
MKPNEAVTALSALAQPTRLDIFRLLVRHGERGLCAGDISQQLETPKPTLSFHLKELSHAGLIESDRVGRSITYRLRISGMRDLMAFLSDDCCQGRPELCTPTQACC